MWDMHEGMGWWMLFGSIMFVVFWGGLIVVAFLFADRFGRGQYSGGSRPLDVARDRYARGEVTREEFQQISEDLRKPA